MIHKVFLDDEATITISEESIVVTSIHVACSPLFSLGDVNLYIYEADQVTPICTLLCNAILNNAFQFTTDNHSFELTTPFLAPRGVYVHFPSAGQATCTVTYMNIGA